MVVQFPEDPGHNDAEFQESKFAVVERGFGGLELGCGSGGWEGIMRND